MVKFSSKVCQNIILKESNLNEVHNRDAKIDKIKTHLINVGLDPLKLAFMNIGELIYMYDLHKNKRGEVK